MCSSLQHFVCTVHIAECTLQSIYTVYSTALVAHNTGDAHTTWLTILMHLQRTQNLLMCTEDNTSDAHTTGVMHTRQHNRGDACTTVGDGAQQHASVAARLRWRSEPRRLAAVRLTWAKTELSETKYSRWWPNWANLAGTEKCFWLQQSEVLEGKMRQGRA